MRVVIIGGSDAGISAALRAREVDPTTDVTVIVADNYPNFSVCGIPYFLGGDVTDPQTLAHRSVEQIENQGVRLLLKHHVTAINAERKLVVMDTPTGSQRELSYDRVIIATGARAVVPNIPGMDLNGVFTIRSMGDGFAVHQYLTEKAPKSAVIVGGGYIGLEMAEALTNLGMEVTLVEHGEEVLKSVTPQLGKIVHNELVNHGVKVVNGVTMTAIETEGTRLKVVAGGFSATTDMVLVSVGVTPNSKLAASAGVALGAREAIIVDRHMETNLPGVYAAGDCAEAWHRLLQKMVYMPLGSTAHKQGHVAGENAAGGHRDFVGILGTQVVKVFDLVIARTGLNGVEAREGGFQPLTVKAKVWDHKAYYPGAHELHMRVIGDRLSGCLLGAQIVGNRHAEVSKRVDIFACAIYAGLSIASMGNLDLTYTPPLSSPWDAVQMGAQTWVRRARELQLEETKASAS